MDAGGRATHGAVAEVYTKSRRHEATKKLGILGARYEFTNFSEVP